MAGPWEQFQTTDQGPWTRFAPIEEKPSKERTFGEAAKDIAAGVVSGAGSLVQLPGQLYGLATGDFSETGALGLGKDIAKYGEEMKSAGLKAREEERRQKIKSAEEKGQWEAFKTAFGETVRDPGLLTSFLAEQAPQLLVPFGAAKVAQVGTAAKAAAAAEGLVGKAAENAVKEVTKAAAERGTRAAIGVGAVQQGADVGAQAYEDIYKELIRKGADPKDAADGALNLARAAGASGAIVSLLAQRLPGARTLEESFAGVPGTGGRLLGAIKGALGEGVSEIAEETGGKFGANLAMREVAPETSLTAGLGETAGMAAIGGVGMGGAAGLARRPALPEGVPTPEAPSAPVAPPAAEIPPVVPSVAERVVDITGVSREAPPSAEEAAETFARMYRMGDEEGRAYAERLTQERLLRLQQEADANAAAIAEQRRREGPPPEVPRPSAPDITRPSLAEEVPAVPSREELLAKQAEVDRRRLEAGLPTGPSSLTPGVQPEVAAPEERSVPRLVDNRPLTEGAARNRLMVMRNMLKNQGGDPESLTIVPHPAAEGRFAIQSLDKPVKFTKLESTAGEKPLSEVVIDPVNAYVNEQRRTNTPAARQFVSDFEAGRITREDVQQAISAERRRAAPPLAVLPEGEIIAPPTERARPTPSAEEGPPVTFQQRLKRLVENKLPFFVSVFERGGRNVYYASADETLDSSKRVELALTKAEQEEADTAQAKLDASTTEEARIAAEAQLQGVLRRAASRALADVEVSKFVPPKPPVVVEEEPPTEEPPGEEPPPPSGTLPTTLEEFRQRMPIVMDKADVREANNEGSFSKLTKALQLSSNPAIRRIGQLGAGIASKITLRKPGTARQLGAGVAGVYRYADDSIQMHNEHAGNEHTNAHETLHALISKAQRFPTDRQKPVVAQIDKLYEHVKKELKRKGVTAYGLTNAREFTAEAMTNPEFQFELMQIPYPGKKSAWTQFVKLVADLLGIQNTNALTEVMNLVDRLAMQKQPRKAVKDKGLVDEMETERPPTLDTSGLTKVIKGRDPQVQAAAQLLKEGKLTREEYEEYVNYYTPIEAVEAGKLRAPSTEEAMRGAVASNKSGLVNQPIADGSKVGLRLDIPATRAGVPTVSVHEGASGKASQGKAKSYTSTAHITNATFEPRSQKAGLDIAVGAGKEPLQTVEGTWVNEDPQSVFEKVKELLKSPDWVQVGFDPTRHGYFYDRKTGEPVASASEVYQIGTLLVAKDVKYAPKAGFLYSLSKEQTQQLQDFQQTLRTLLNKFGLKDVGLNIVEGMRDAGSYSQQLIRIAADEANPVRTLRHEAIHALRELGFFTEAQWNSLFKMAKDKWIDQYLKQRNEQGRPLKAGEESRYDAYMREYNGDMEKIIEEAVADAFADFDATKPPVGMLQALLKRMKDLFQSIKSALTKVESPEQIFGKVEKGELKAGAREARGEAKSLRDRATANFLRWFGDSKVVDENGEPLVVYHGTASDFTEFRRTRSGEFGPAIYTTDSAREAGEYGVGQQQPGVNIMPVYVSLKNPYKKGVDSFWQEFGRDDGDAAAVARAQEAGYDGVIAKRPDVYYDSETRKFVDRGDTLTHYIAFRPEQIKSAIGNNGDYSLTNADIRKSLSGKRSTLEVARIFGQMVKRAEEELSSALFNWNDSRLNEDKDKIIVYPGRDQRFVRGKEGGKSNVSKAEFIDWLMSDAPFDTSVYGEDITRDVEWKSEIETLRSIVTTPDIRKSLGKVTAAAQKVLQKQPMPEKGLSHVSPELTKLAQPIFFPQNKTILDRIDSMKDRFWQRLAQRTADQFRTIKEYSPLGYMQARLSKSIDGGLEGLLFHGQVFDDGGALNIKKNTKGMMEILKPIGNELDSYLMWVALNRESNLPESKRSKIPNMDQLVARRGEFAAGELNGKPRVEVYQDVLRQMNQLNKSVLDIALAKGLIDQNGYAKFSNDIYYIPFYKKMEEDGTIEGAQTASGLTSQYFSKELKGDEAPFGDLMENIVRNWSHILSASMKNAAAKTTIDDAMKLQAAEPNLKAGLEMRDGVVYSTKSDKPIEAKFDEDGKQIYSEGELRPDLTTSGTGMAKIMVDGQPMYFKVTDELLMESISSIGYMGPKSKFLDVMRDFKNMLQFGVTASPIFKVNNLIRDSVSALAVSDLKKSPVYNVMTGISLSKKDSPTYISALAGGAIFNFGSAYEGDQAKLIKRLLDQGVDDGSILDNADKIKKALKKSWEAYQDLGNRSEAANRLALYQQLRDKGMSHLEASFMARDLLDFSMQGSWGTFRFLTQVVPFMNARIQGLYKLGRDGINPTVRVLYNGTTGKEIDVNDKIRAAQFATVSAAVMLASALLYLTFKDDEDFKKRDAWDRDNFWWFKIPSLDIAFRIPKPFEVGALGTLTERTLEQILDQGAEGKQFGESLARTLWDTFALNPTPQVFKPLVDLYSNKDSFSGAPIESAGLERLSKQERRTDTTSPLAIALGGLSTLFPEKFQVSPVQMDYAIKGYFGWLGAMASMSSTYAVMPFKEGEYPDARWLDRASLGLVRDLPAPQSSYVTAFYNSSKEISQAYADMRHYREMGDAEKVQEILEEKGDKIMLAKFYDKTSKNIANVRKQIQLITNDKNLDGAEKKEMIERMKLIMSDLAKQAEEVRKSMKP